MTPQVFDALGSMQSLAVDLDGTGLASSPLGFANLKLITLDGTGLASSPLGFSTLHLIAIDGTGLASSPLGFRADHMLSIGGTGLASSPLGLFNSQPVFLGNPGAAGSSLNESYIGDHLSGGGWEYQDGVAGASFLIGSGVASIFTDLSALELVATGFGHTELGAE
jgi:hypothetical protein